MQKGFVGILVLVVVLLAVGVGGYFVYTNYSNNQTSIVQPTTKTTSKTSPTPDETVNWKTYTDSEMNIEFKYPSEWFVKTYKTAVSYFLVVQSFKESQINERKPGYYAITFNKGFSAGGKSGLTGYKTIIELKQHIQDYDSKKEVYIGTDKGDILTRDNKDFEINGFQAFSRKIYYESEPDNYQVEIYILDSKGKVIFIQPSHEDAIGNKIYNQILSTFKFTN